MIRTKTEAEIKLMREGGRQLAEILRLLAEKVEPGITGIELDTLAEKEIKSRGLIPILKGYQGYPSTLCVTVNEGVVHGIPNKERFANGDLVKLDLSLSNRGMVVDAALTTIAGTSTDKDASRLIEGTKKALAAGIAAIRGEGTRVGDISSATQDELNRFKLGIVRDLVGHGVGYGVHEDPEVPNYGVAGSGPLLPAGATIAVEPMATLGDWRVGMLADGWTIITRDGSLSAHFEHTILITEDSAEILTGL